MADDLSSDLASLRIDRNAPPRSRSWLKWAGLLVLLGATGAAYTIGRPHLEASVFKAQVELTEVATVSPAQASIELTSSGYVVADRRSRVAPKVAGRVAKVHIERGQQVEAGQLLLELDPADDEAAIAAAKSRVAAAHANALSAKARAETTRAELAEMQQRAGRELRLAQEGVSAAGIAEDLQARVNSLKQSVKAAEAQARAAEADATALGAQVSMLRVGLDNLTLEAPISGRIVNSPPQAGEYIGPQPAGVVADMGGIEVADFSSLEIETDVAEARLYLVKPDAPAEIVLDAFPTQRFRGKVREITPKVDRAKATVAVRVAFVDPTERVLPDMSARVSFLTEALDAEAMRAKPKTVIPASAVVERAGAKMAFVVDGERVRGVLLELGPPFGDGFELVRGPAPGTRVVKSPPDTLKDGQKFQEKTNE